MDWFAVNGRVEQEYVVWCNQLNPCFAAAWFGLIMTAINMFPIGQLDGGHTTYTLFGKAAHWIARGTLVLAIAFIVYQNTPTLAIMILLLLLIGPDHPPTTDDSIPLGGIRTVVGCFSPSNPDCLLSAAYFSDDIVDLQDIIWQRCHKYLRMPNRVNHENQSTD